MFGKIISAKKKIKVLINNKKIIVDNASKLFKIIKSEGE